MTVNMVTLPETPETRFRHSAIYQTIKALAILSCLCGSKMVLLGWSLVSVKCLALAQENDHAILIVKCEFVAYN